MAQAQTWDVSGLPAASQKPTATGAAPQGTWDTSGLPKAPAKRTWTDTAVDLIPAAGMTIGGVTGAIPGAALGGAAGAAGRQLVNRARGKGGPATMTEAATDIGISGAVGGATEGIGVAAKAVAPKIGEWAMRSALGKVTAATLKDYRTSTQALAKTLIANGVNVTKRGLTRLDTLIEATDLELSHAIQSLKGTISPQAVASRTKDVAAMVAKQVNPVDDLATVSASTQEFLQHPQYSKPTVVGRGKPTFYPSHTQFPPPRIEPRMQPLTGAQAQELKRGTYAQLRRKSGYGELKGAAIETQKALAKGLREEIEGLATRQGATDVAALNARESKLLAAHEAVAQRLATLQNPSEKSLFWAAQHPLITLLAIAGREGAPLRSIIARSVSAGAQTFRYVAPALVRAAAHAWVGAADPAADADADQRSPTTTTSK